MLNYIIKRLLLLVPVFIGVSVLVFTIMQLAPGDPVMNMLGEDPEGLGAIRYKMLIEKMGLDKPIHIQYIKFLERFFHGDLGRSIVTRKLVWDEIITRYPRTLELAFASIIIAVIIAIPAGIISATRQNTIADNICMGGAVLGISIPSFWMGIMLIYIFAFKLKIAPFSGFGGIEHLILPAITLGTRSAGSLARLTRSSMLEILRQDFVRTARSKGLSERTVLYKHALKNALLPVITSLGGRFGALLGGSLVTETVFAYPGLGMLTITAIQTTDYPVVQGALMITTFTFVLIYVIVDIIGAYIDPRVEYEN